MLRSLYTHGPATLILLVSFFLCVVGVFSSPSVPVALLGGCCFVAMFLVLWPVYILKDQNIASPLYLFSIVVFFSMPARFALLSAYPELERIAWFLEGRSIESFGVGGLMTVIGLSGMAMGYISASRRVKPPSVMVIDYAEVSLKRLRVVAFISFALSAWAMYAFLQVTGIESISAKRSVVDGGVRFSLGYLRRAPEISSVVTVVLLAMLLQRGRPKLRDVLLVVVGLFMTLSWPFVNSDRSAIPLIVAMLGLVYFLVKNRLPWRLMGLGLLASIFMFVIMTELRMEGRNLAHKEDVLANMNVAERAFVSTAGAFNMGGFVANSLAFDAVPAEIEYRFGGTYLDALTRPVPRSLWPEKPVSVGQQWLVAFRGERFAATVGGGASAGAIAEAYLNFSWLGVFAVLFLYGFALRILYKSMHPYFSFSPMAVAFYVMAAKGLPLGLYGRDFAAGLTEIGLLVFSFIFLGFMIRGRAAARGGGLLAGVEGVGPDHLVRSRP